MDTEEAKEQLISLRENAKANIDTDEIFRLDYEAINIALNELEKKDKIIDLMAECIDIELSSQKLGIILNKKVEPLQSYRKDIKQYFEKKVEEK